MNTTIEIVKARKKDTTDWLTGQLIITIDKNECLKYHIIDINDKLSLQIVATWPERISDLEVDPETICHNTCQEDTSGALMFENDIFVDNENSTYAIKWNADISGYIGESEHGYQQPLSNFSRPCVLDNIHNNSKIYGTWHPSRHEN